MRPFKQENPHKLGILDALLLLKNSIFLISSVDKTLLEIIIYNTDTKCI